MNSKFLMLFTIVILSFWYSLALDCSKYVCNIKQDSLKFFVLGDWGGKDSAPFYTKTQGKVNKSMSTLGNQVGTRFQIIVGDNFYKDGVKNEFDPRFHTSFEEVYTDSILKRTPWYIIAGNHDHYGNVSAQVAYHQHSWRWNFPSLYYTVKYQLNSATTIDFVMIDTVILCGGGQCREKPTQLMSNLAHVTILSKTLRKQDNVTAAEEQWIWIENQLRSSKANYLFVAGHYPVYSVSLHGSEKCLVDRLDPLLMKYNVTAYLSGHDHNLQHFQIERETKGIFMDYVLSGFGAVLYLNESRLDEVPKNSFKFKYPLLTAKPEDQRAGGFVLVSLTFNKVVYTYYNGNGAILKEFSNSPRFF